MSSLPNFLWGASGGIPYHFAALRYRRRLWTSFVTAVNDWLCHEWQPRSRELLIFGPSAGWTLEERFLGQFTRVVAVEPDPLARVFLRRRFPRQHFELLPCADLLPWFQTGPRAFSNFLASHSGAAILFSNILGQLELLRDLMTTPPAEARDEFRQALRSREWASFHDVLSSRQTSILTVPRTMPKEANASCEFAGQFFPKGGTLIDHDTLWLHEDRPWLAIPWQLRPQQSHIIGCVKD